MNTLNVNPLLLVGDMEDKQYFQNYFNHIELVKSNREALSMYYKNSFFTIVLNCNSCEDSAFDVCKEIREHDRQTVIAILADIIDKEELEKALPLHLSGCIHKPFKKKQVENILSNVIDDLKFLSTNLIRLKEGYHFCINQQILYNASSNEVKLTKNELKLLNILIKAKNELIDGTSIEYEIWEEDSLSKDCANRLKNLLYNLRKKLPKDSISNNYKLGYKLICP